jgi:hypothetical protein
MQIFTKKIPGDKIFCTGERTIDGDAILYKKQEYAIIHLNAKLCVLIIFLDGKLHTIMGLSLGFLNRINSQQYRYDKNLEKITDDNPSVLRQAILISNSIRFNGEYLQIYDLETEKMVDTTYKFQPILDLLTGAKEGQFGYTKFEFKV